MDSRTDDGGKDSAAERLRQILEHNMEVFNHAQAIHAILERDKSTATKEVAEEGCT